MASALKFFTRGEGPDWTGFLDREARVEGTLEVPGTFRLDGTLRGRIISNHALVLGETAEVEGDIEGVRIEIYGRFHGTLRASDRVQLHLGASVTGDVYSPCLVLEPGARFEGHCYLGPNGEPSEPLLVPIRATLQEEKSGTGKGSG
jgi:cytoskeletal protein CcmA (bactofilin family)